MPINAPAGMAAGELVVSGAIDEVIEETDELASLALLSVDELPPEHADSPSAAAAAKPAMAIRFGVRVMWLNFLVGGPAGAVPVSPYRSHSEQPGVRMGPAPNQGHNEPVTSSAARCRVLILGSTGSIGTQALEVIAANPDRFEVVGLAAGGGNADLLARQAAETGVTNVAVADPDAAVEATYRGPDAVTHLVENTEADVVLNALVGALGLKPTLAALHSGARLALANKESLVAGGPLVLKAAAPGQIVPVDSEHSALAQCLRSGSADEVARLVLTASGGPFRGWAAADLETVTPEQAGAHPTWSMGPMNTLNSASMVNKGLELIETHLLFGIDYDRIDVVVHPQSIVHSMVTFTDGSTIAQASPPDMRLPIALALGWPQRVAGAAAACDWTMASTWTFEPLDDTVFPAVNLAREAGRRGGSLTAVYNAANEEAAAAFLQGRLKFPAIVRTVADVLHAADQWAQEPATVEEILDAQDWARDRARSAVNREVVASR